MDALKEMPGASLGAALGSFSLGVELGHQAVILPLFGLLYVFRRKLKPESYERGLQAGTLAISAGGVYFLVIAISTFILR